MSPMETFLPILSLFVGAILAVLILRFIAKPENRATEGELATLKAQLTAKMETLTKLEQAHESLQSEQRQLQESHSQQQATIATLQTRLDAERRQAEEKLTLLSENRAQMVTEFQNLANKILDEKSKKFTEQNRGNIEQLLNPLREQLVGFRKKVEDVYDKESKDRMSLFHEISHLKELNQRISDDAINLTNALKGQSQTRGAWGEVILERVLEESGLHKGREYETQGSFTNEEGRRLRPDVIIHLPEGKDIIVDSKLSLNAYERYCSASDETERQVALKEHISSMQSHMRGLSIKNYVALPGVRSLDFVLMFVPIEAAFIVAVEHDRELFSQAFDRNIMVVSPSTLLATLRTVHNIWRYEDQNSNALEIADSAGKFYDQFVLFVESLEEVGGRLKQAQSAYDSAHKRLVSGRGNLVKRTETLKKLGAKARKRLDSKLLVAADAEEEVGPITAELSDADDKPVS